jgi:threonine efflux protein
VSYLPLLLSLFLVDLVAAMSPGPNFTLVTHSAVHRTRRYAVAVSIGFVIANLIWCLAVVFGLALLFDLQPWLYDLLRLLGGSYLILLGIQVWSSGENSETKQPVNSHAAIGTGVVRGLLTNLGNPKSAVYFGSVFAVFLKPGTPAWVQMAAVAIVLIDTILWYGSVAVLMSTDRAQRVFARFNKAINRVAGVALVLFGLRLLASRARPAV